MKSPTEFKKGNKFWERRSKHGRDKLFKSPELLWKAACEYFEWCENNPLIEVKGFAFQGVVTMKEFPKMRAMTIGGLCLYLDCTPDYFRAFKNQERKNKADFIPIINKIEQTIYNQKFEGAAADLLNANIIARDLGLADKTEIDMAATITETTNFKIKPRG